MKTAKARAIASARVEHRVAITSPVAIVESIFNPHGITTAISFMIGIPADMITVIEPSDGMRTVNYVIKRSPNPAIDTMVAPVTVVIGVPTPGIGRNPGPAIAVNPGPVAMAIGNPCNVSYVRNPVPDAIDVNPAALTRQSAVWIKNTTRRSLRLSDHYHRRRGIRRNVINIVEHE
jgi:hypothetical protein